MDTAKNKSKKKVKVEPKPKVKSKPKVKVEPKPKVKVEPKVNVKPKSKERITVEYSPEKENGLDENKYSGKLNKLLYKIKSQHTDTDNGIRFCWKN